MNRKRGIMPKLKPGFSFSKNTKKEPVLFKKGEYYFTTDCTDFHRKKLNM
jgi:hypothetical protein